MLHDVVDIIHNQDEFQYKHQNPIKELFITIGKMVPRQDSPHF